MTLQVIRQWWWWLGRQAKGYKEGTPLLWIPCENTPSSWTGENHWLTQEKSTSTHQWIMNKQDQLVNQEREIYPVKEEWQPRSNQTHSVQPASPITLNPEPPRVSLFSPNLTGCFLKCLQNTGLYELQVYCCFHRKKLLHVARGFTSWKLREVQGPTRRE